jgi:hypothetical protein
VTTDPILRAKQVKALKAYYKDSTERFQEWVAGGYIGHPRECLPYPEFCRYMKCEAKTRSGHPCKNDGTSWANGRCKYHGGASNLNTNSSLTHEPDSLYRYQLIDTWLHFSCS